jgi:hypothetical protein
MPRKWSHQLAGKTQLVTKHHFHAVVWIDHREARVFHFNSTEVERLVLRPDHPTKHIQLRPWSAQPLVRVNHERHTDNGVARLTIGIETNAAITSPAVNTSPAFSWRSALAKFGGRCIVRGASSTASRAKSGREMS